MLMEMIVITTANPDEIVNVISSAFLINDHFAIVADADEIDDDVIVERHRCVSNGDILRLREPLLIISEVDVAASLRSTYELTHIDLTDMKFDVDEWIDEFIMNGFLPNDVDVAMKYAEGLMPMGVVKWSTEVDITMTFFVNLGVLKVENVNGLRTYLPTESMMNALDDTEWVGTLMVIVNNAEMYLTEDVRRKYEESLFELLKMVDVKVVEGVNEWMRRCDEDEE